MLNEIGFVILSGFFSCWIGEVKEESCAKLSSNPPGALNSSNIKDYIEKITYEDDGIKVFERKGNTFLIKNSEGKSIWISFDEYEKFGENIHGNSKQDGWEHHSWKFLPLNEVFTKAYLVPEENFLESLVKDDLTTPVTLEESKIKEIKRKSIESFLEKTSTALPIAYFIGNPFCKSPSNKLCNSELSTFQKKDSTKENTEFSKTEMIYLLGKDITDNQDKIVSKKVFILGDDGEAYRVRSSNIFATEEKWIKKADIKYPIISIPEKERLKIFIEELIPVLNEFAPSNRNYKEEGWIDFNYNNKGTWFKDTYWIHVDICGENICTDENGKPFAQGWLPYVNPKSKKKNFNWRPRGC